MRKLKESKRKNNRSKKKKKSEDWQYVNYLTKTAK